MNERDAIRDRLKHNKLTCVWLIQQLRERGIITEKTELSSVLAGTRNGAKVDAIIKTAQYILDEYEEGFGKK